MKKKMFLLYPWLFGLLAGVIYFMAYARAWGPADSTTLLLVISAAVAWSSLIFIKTGNKHRALKIYMIVSLFFSMIYIEAVRISQVDPVLHRAAWGLIVLAMILLNVLINLMKKGRS